MNKQEFIFVFPQSGETITKKMNPLAVKDAAVKYLKIQKDESVNDIKPIGVIEEGGGGRNERNQFQGNTSKNRCVG